jgi:hypothetical protein
LFGESERKRSLGRARDRWKDDVKIDTGEVSVSMWTGFIWLGKRRKKPRGSRLAKNSGQWSWL